MEKKGFDLHTTNVKKNREHRTKHLDTVKEIMKNPDEVWLCRTNADIKNNIPKLNNYVMVKYYKGEAMAAYCKKEGDNMVFKTWFPLRDKTVRSGILVKKK